MSERKWSRKYEKCVICGSVEHKHHAKGICNRCYGESYYKENLRVHPDTVRKEMVDVVAEVLSKRYGIVIVYKENTVKLVAHGQVFLTHVFE